METVGIIRKIDDLGRVYIPKDIRKELKIAEGDPIEIFMDGENLVLKKYAEKDDFFEELRMVCQKYEGKVASNLIEQVQTFIKKKEAKRRIKIWKI